MSSVTFNASLEMATEECCNCGIVFGMPKSLQVRCRNDGSISFYCPAGHPQHYTKSRVTILEEQLKAEREAKARLDETLTRARAERDHHWMERKKLTTRVRNLKTRMKNGVCPCCHRSFENLRRHMETQHPAFAEHEGDALAGGKGAA